MDSESDVYRKLMEVAGRVRADRLTDDYLIRQRPLLLREIYTLCYYIARELNGTYHDVCIMVGDRLTERGDVQHHWLEIPSRRIFLGPAFDAFDGFHPIRVGKTSDEDFAAVYRHGLDSHFDVDNPRDKPEMIYGPRTAFDPEN